MVKKINILNLTLTDLNCFFRRQMLMTMMRMRMDKAAVAEPKVIAKNFSSDSSKFCWASAIKQIKEFRS